MVKKPAKKTPLTLERTWPWILTIGGWIGFISAATLAIEKVELLKNPAYVPTCNLSPLISCGSVMKTWQASLFGFPNPFIGIAGFAIVTTIGMALLAGLKPAALKRWFWLGLEFGTLFGVLFIHWLFSQSVYQIQALCPYCMVVWAVTIPIFFYTTLYNLRTGVIAAPKSLKGTVAFIGRHHGDILLVWFLLIIIAILNHFWYYWQTLI